MAVLFDSWIYDLTLAITFLVICLYMFFTSTFNYWKDRGVPYIEPVPFFGNIKDQLFGKKGFTDMYQGFYDAKPGERYVGIYEISKPLLVIRDPELAEQILIKDFVHFYNRGFPSDPEIDPLSNNLFNLNGTTWRNLRYKLAPTFTSGKLRGMFEQISNCGEALVKSIEEQSKKNRAIEGKPLMSSFIFEVIASVAFGLQLSKDSEDSKNFMRITEKIFNPSKMLMMRLILVTFMPKIKNYIKVKQFPEEVDDVVMSLVRRTLDYRRKNNIKRNDFLQLMLNLQKQEKDGNFNFQKDLEKDQDYQPEDDVIDQMKHVTEAGEDQLQNTDKEFMTDSVIAAQAFVFFTGGSESTASTVNYALYCLSQNPEIQKKVQEELDSVLARNNNKWTYEMMKEMVYMEQVIQETLRMFPTSPLLFRECTKPYNVPGSTLVIEKGVRVIIPVVAFHNDPQHYDTPQEFNPDRFQDNNFRPSGTYFPFGSGPRVCIAMRFAALEVKVVLARILSSYTVKLSPKTVLPMSFSKSSFLLIPTNPLWFEFDNRGKA